MALHNNTLPYHRHTLAIALALALTTGSVYAATINVTGPCTLVNAIHNANADADTDGASGCPAGSGADILNLNTNKTYTLNSVNNQNEGPNGLPSITSQITFNGNGAAIKRSNTVGTPNFRLLHIGNNGNLTLNAVKILGGRLSGNFQYGGAINNGGILMLNNCTISGNHNVGVGAIGSGIANMGQSSLTLNNSTVSGNSGFHGGAILNDAQSIATVNNSTVSGNIATDGHFSGINNQGNMTLTNSTVSSNRSLVNWGIGGIGNSATLTLIHTTVSDNYSAYGNVAGMGNSGTMTLINSIVANSKNGSDCYTNTGTNSSGMTLFQGRSIIQDGTCNPPLSVNPRLAPLLDNGGPTLTHALRKGSPAINIANSYCVNIDQRYVRRPQPIGGICDAGAFERINAIPTNFTTPIPFFDTQVANGGIVGVGGKPTFKLEAVRNQLLTAIDNKIALLNTQACSQLAKTLTRLDGDNTPDNDDYATGSQIAALIAQINTLRTSWTCQ